MNPFGNTGGSGDYWDYTVNALQAQQAYLVLTEDTNKTTTPIKFAPPPFVPAIPGPTVHRHGDGFENHAEQEGISAGSFINGWRVISGDVDVFNPASGGHLATADELAPIFWI